jgi:hypothetical protein
MATKKNPKLMKIEFSLSARNRLSERHLDHPPYLPIKEGVIGQEDAQRY